MEQESALAIGHSALRGSAATHEGNVRTLNEDAFLIAPGVYAVADGMGGHQAGEVASRITIDTCATMATGEPLAVAAVADMVSRANDEVRRYAIDHHTEGMGCTLVGAVLVDNGGVDALVVFNVGDSRCYALIDDQPMAQLTVDHSLVQEMVDNGELTVAQARTHAQRNVVTRAIGIENSVAADYVVVPAAGRVRLLLCSDGVSTELTDEDIGALLVEHGDPEVAARSIVDAVLAGRAADNATALVVDFVPPVPPGEVPSTLDEATGPPPNAAARSRARTKDDSAAETDAGPPPPGLIDVVPL